MDNKMHAIATSKDEVVNPLFSICFVLIKAPIAVTINENSQMVSNASNGNRVVPSSLSWLPLSMTREKNRPRLSAMYGNLLFMMDSGFVSGFKS